jgi:type II secretion system protein J
MRRGAGTIRGAFTLVELMVAAAIVVLIAGATTTALTQMIRARDGADARRQAYERAFAGAGMIARDAAEIARDSDLLYSKVQVSSGGTAGPGGEEVERDGLLMLIRTLRRVRGLEASPEGADFEVQYRVEQGSSGPVLWRRVDPALDGAIDGGGIASPVALGVVSLAIQACDDQDWWDTWDSDSEGLPRGLRITVTATDDSGRIRAVARKVVAIDRVPLPPTEDESESESESEGGA